MTEEPHTSFTKLETDFSLLRPRGAGPEVPFWEPRLDLAHVADPIIRYVYRDLESGTWFDDECATGGVEKKDVVPALVAVHKMIHMDLLGESRLCDLWEAAGLDAVNPRSLQVAFAMIGQACMAACWRGKRVAMGAEASSEGRVGATETGELTAQAALRLTKKIWRSSPWAKLWYRLRLASRRIAERVAALFWPSTPR